MRFRPCIDLHQGKVKQIVGGTLSDSNPSALRTNFTTDLPPGHFARLYRRDGLSGGHVILLGPGNESAARDALNAWPGGMQVGGGINPSNAEAWIQAGASAVIVTSYIFDHGALREERLREMSSLVGRERLVLDLSCRCVENEFVVVTDRWQTLTQLTIGPDPLAALSAYCSEFLIHAADIEGQQAGVDASLIERLAEWSPITVTYAGGVGSMADVEAIEYAGQGRIDFTVGSALDLFGGAGVRYSDLVSRFGPRAAS